MSITFTPPLPPGIHSSQIGFFSGIRTVFTFRPYLLLFLVQLFGWLGVTFIQGNYALYIKYTLDMEALYPYVIAVLLIATIMWMPLWQLLMRRIGKKASLTVGLWMFMVIILSLLFIDFAGDYGIYLAFPVSVIGGAGVAAGYLFPWWAHILIYSVVYLSLSLSLSLSPSLPPSLSLSPSPPQGQCYQMWEMKPIS